MSEHETAEVEVPMGPENREKGAAAEAAWNDKFAAYEAVLMYGGVYWNVMADYATDVSAAGDEGFAPPSAEVRVYYGAADTCIGMAVATVGELVDACLNS